MQNPSSAFFNAAAAKAREPYAKATLQTADLSTYELGPEDIASGSLGVKASCMKDSFELGAVIAADCSIALNNQQGQWDGIDLDGATLWPYSGFKLPDNTIEYVLLGTFIIDDPGRPYSTVQLGASDRLILLDEPFADVSITFPATNLQILQAIALHCNVPLASSISGIDNASYSVSARPADDLSCRDVVGMIAMMAAGFARMSRIGEMAIISVSDMTAQAAFEMPAGSRFNFKQTSDLITITGLEYDDGENGAIQLGSGTYVLNLDNNPFIQANSSSVIQGIFNRVNGFVYTAFEANYPGNPALDPGDKIRHLAQDGRDITSFITTHRFKHAGRSFMEAEGKSAVENRYKSQNAKRLSSLTSKIREQSSQLTTYQQVSAQFADLISQAGGFYRTNVPQEDGSIIAYIHDNALLNESTYIWRIAGSVFAWSSDGGETWNGGLSADGNMLLRTLSVMGINAEWVTIGPGTTFESGYDPSTKETPAGAQAKADAAYAAAQSFVNGVASDLQNQIDGSITTWFYAYVPSLVNAPANAWTTTELKNQHLGDLFYDTATGYSYRFQLVTGTYSWAKITDTDVTKALSDAAAAQDTADSKRRVFTATPTTPYDVGDLWAGGPAGDLKRCSTARASGAYVAGDWTLASKYTDDTTANAAQDDATQALSDAATAIANAATAQGTADGKVTTFVQATAPTAEGVGDLWIDSDDGNKLYRWSGTAWVSIKDAGIAQAISDAADAQATADGKIVTFYQAAQPTASAVGDLWVDTDDNNKLYRWSGSAWQTARDATIAIAQAAASAAQSTADTASSNATSALSQLTDISADNKITAVEKQLLKKEWDAIVAEKTVNDTQADLFTITTEKTTYGTKYTVLNTYINTTYPLFTSLTTTTTIDDGATLRLKFKEYYDARTALLNAIAAKAKTLADAAQTTANTTKLSLYDLKNLVTNGDFSDGTTGWTASGATLSATAKTLLITGAGNSSYPQAFQHVIGAAISGHLVYGKARVRVTNSVCLSITLQVYKYGGTSISITVNNPTINTWYDIDLSKIFIQTQDGNLRVLIYHRYADVATANGKVAEVQYVTAMDLTALGIDTMTATEIDEMLSTLPNSWFNKYSLSTSTIRLLEEFKARGGINIIQNGDFEDTTGWTAGYSTISASSNTMTDTGNGTNAYAGIAQYTDAPVNTLHDYFLKAKVRVTNSACTMLTIYYDGTTAGANKLVKTYTSPTSNTWYDLSVIDTLPSDATGNFKFMIYQNYADAATANGKIMEVQYALAIDLSNLSSKPTAAQMDIILDILFPDIAWFNGTMPSQDALTSVFGALGDAEELRALARAGQTIIEGGYLRTSLIEAKSILADMIDTDTLWVKTIRADSDVKNYIDFDPAYLWKGQTLSAMRHWTDDAAATPADVMHLQLFGDASATNAETRTYLNATSVNKAGMLLDYSRILEVGANIPFAAGDGQSAFARFTSDADLNAGIAEIIANNSDGSDYINVTTKFNEFSVLDESGDLLKLTRSNGLTLSVPIIAPDAAISLNTANANGIYADAYFNFHAKSGTAADSIWHIDNYLGTVRFQVPIGSNGGDIRVDGYSIWHAGNLTPSNYLPLAGGTMSGNINMGSNDIVGSTTDCEITARRIGLGVAANSTYTLDCGTSNSIRCGAVYANQPYRNGASIGKDIGSMRVYDSLGSRYVTMSFVGGILVVADFS